jgi:hypothetical protein
MFKKIILFVIISFIFTLSTFAIDNQTKKNKIGPSSSPKIVGPKTAPPTREEINILKYTKDEEFIKKEEKNIFEKI